MSGLLAEKAPVLLKADLIWVLLNATTSCPLYHCLQVKNFERLSSLFFAQELTDGNRDHRPYYRTTGPTPALGG
jgi:hypothetical protein